MAELRSGAEAPTDRELSIFLHLPPVLRRGVVTLAGLAHDLNLLPRGFIEGDPFFASAFATNLGSVGIDAVYHHLYDYGTIAVFCALGLVHDDVVARDGEPTVTRVATLRFSYDERVKSRPLRSGGRAVPLLDPAGPRLATLTRDSARDPARIGARSPRPTNRPNAATIADARAPYRTVSTGKVPANSARSASTTYVSGFRCGRGLQPAGRALQR